MKNLLVICLLLGLVACESNWDEKNLPGKWKSVEWIQLDTGKSVDRSMAFEFDSTGRYSVDYGSEIEEGNYWISGDFLHTVEDAKAEKKVRIIKLNSDTLVLEMNRAGYLESLSLVKE